MENECQDESQEKSSFVQFSNAAVASRVDMCRPSTSLARGVQITEFQDARNNPQPLQNSRSISYLDGYLSPQKLRAITGIDDLEKVHFLEMKVDSRETSLGNFGMHLPNLTQLKLSNSIIINMRDLGSSLGNLQVLWLAQCGMEDLDGVSAMINLQELYLSYNEISDISPCGMLENLQILDVEGNNISEISQLSFLVLCQKLSNLTLEGNPVCVTSSPEDADPEYNYRNVVKKLIPHLVTLDEIQLFDEDATDNRGTPSVFEEDWKLLDELMSECPITALDDSSEAKGHLYAEEMAKPVVHYRPGSALKPHSASGIKHPGTQKERPTCIQTGVGSRPGTLSSQTGSAGSRSLGVKLGDDDDGDDDDPTCELTAGGVICGNLSVALRSRRHKASSKKAEMLLSQFSEKSENGVGFALEDDESFQQLTEELKQWKEGHRKRVEEIAKTKAPQILKIEYDDVTSSDTESNNLTDTDDGGESHERMAVMMMTYGDFSDGNSEKLFTRNMPLTTTELRTGRLSYQTVDSGIGSLQSLQSAHQGQDESVDVDEEEELESYDADGPIHRRSFSSGFSGLQTRSKDGSGIGIYEPVPPITPRRSMEPLRPVSGPVMAPRRKFRLDSGIGTTSRGTVDSIDAVTCESEPSFETSTSASHRAGTSPAALGKAPTVPSTVVTSQLRRGLLTSIPLLPSKYNK